MRVCDHDFKPTTTILPTVAQLGMVIRLKPCNAQSTGIIKSPSNVIAIENQGESKPGKWVLLYANKKETVYRIELDED
jgi:hypothetical protein